MMLALLPWFISGSIALTSLGLLLSRNWRLSLAFLAWQYFGAFWLVLGHWTLSMSATLLVAGWMAAAVMGMTSLNVKTDPAGETSWPQGALFRVLASGLVLMAISAAAGSLDAWLPHSSLPLSWGALVLIGMGFLHLGMTLQPLRVILGLLTTLLGFELLYSLVENSLLVSGLLVAVTLGLALAGSYLLLLEDQTP
jgi:hypothetical protein